MRTIRTTTWKTSTATASAFAALLFAGAPAFADAASDLVARGEYVARAADCAACHAVPEGGKPYAGGYAISSPLGKIFSTNITPSKQYGIGNWSEAEFARAVRKGVLPDGGHLYPAMPYDAYAGITDDDMQALYAYFMSGVKAVDEPPVHHTALAFPFNQRWLMAGWNLMFAHGDPFTPKPNEDKTLARGRYLVDTLGHCASCHTPRNLFMANDGDRSLAGAELGGWLAPNITSDKTAGIGAWSDQELIDFFRNGHVEGKAVAAGGMGEAVEHSLRYLKTDDLAAMAAYLKSVPAKADPAQKQPAFSYGKPVENHYDFAGKDAQAMLDQVRAGTGQLTRDAERRSDFASVADGALLYDSACASCHQPTGAGTKDGYYPSLYHSTATGSATGHNLVMTVLDGVNREGADGKMAMPAFGDDLSDAQVASLASFVAKSFGNPDMRVSAQDVALWRGGGAEPVIAKLGRLALPVGAGLVVIIILAAAIFIGLRRKRAVAA